MFRVSKHNLLNRICGFTGVVVFETLSSAGDLQSVSAILVLWSHHLQCVYSLFAVYRMCRFMTEFVLFLVAFVVEVSVHL